MSEIEKIQRYIERTSMKNGKGKAYQMNLQEMFGLAHMTEDDCLAAICMAFDYGKAKGYRAAKAEVRG